MKGNATGPRNPARAAPLAQADELAAHAGSAAALLRIVSSLPVPAEAWKAEMTGRSITAGVTASAEAMNATTANEALFERWKLPGTPYSLYTSKETGQVKVLFGTADDFAGFLKDVGVQP